MRTKYMLAVSVGLALTQAAPVSFNSPRAEQPNSTRGDIIGDSSLTARLDTPKHFSLFTAPAIYSREEDSADIHKEFSAEIIHEVIPKQSKPMSRVRRSSLPDAVLMLFERHLGGKDKLHKKSPHGTSFQFDFYGIYLF